MSEKAKILLVEEDLPTAAQMTFLLTDAGYDVKVAFNGRSGLEMATSQKFDLILLDVRLPGISGFDICCDLKQRHISYRTPIVFVSGFDSETYRKKILQCGAETLIAKPFDAMEFLSRISPLVEETTIV